MTIAAKTAIEIEIMEEVTEIEIEEGKINKGTEAQKMEEDGIDNETKDPGIGTEVQEILKGVQKDHMRRKILRRGERILMGKRKDGKEKMEKKKDGKIMMVKRKDGKIMMVKRKGGKVMMEVEMVEETMMEKGQNMLSPLHFL